MRLRSSAKPIANVSEIAPWRPLPEMRAVKTPLDSSADATLQPLNAPEPAIVRATLAGTPAAARTQGKGAAWRRIERIDNLWEVDLWGCPNRRVADTSAS